MTGGTCSSSDSVPLDADRSCGKVPAGLQRGLEPTV